MKWKTIKGFENYEVNTCGDIRSKPRTGTKGGIIKPFFGKKNGDYLKVHIYNNGKQYQPFVHRIVAETFLPKIKGKTEVNHINGIKIDNEISNLEWVSRSENMIHANESGLIKRKKVGQYKNGELIAVFSNCHRASTMTNIQYASIYRCLGGVFKQAGGYEWKYM